MKIIVTGTRGIPDIQGGVETHCQELYPQMVAENDFEIIILRRSAYVTNLNNVSTYKGLSIKTLYSPKRKSFEAIFHSILAVFYAAGQRPDILHIHAVGPNLVTPLARLLGMNVIMTHHGPDYERKKWSTLAKLFLRLGEWSGVKFANKVIVISDEIGKSIAQKYNRKDYILIPNGVPPAIKNNETGFLEEIGLEPGKYIFTLGRFVPEKGFDYLIDAYNQSKCSSHYKLVIAGDADHESEYSLKLKDKANKARVVLTGFVSGSKLHQLFTNARLFILPSFYEGLPISLLEAMSYGLNILVSDIAANKELDLAKEDYFAAGDINELSERIDKKMSFNITKDYSAILDQKYNWGKIAKKTILVYNEVLNKKSTIDKCP
jgi:glycosyltransferase involved in cell wall biosynthesis